MPEETPKQPGDSFERIMVDWAKFNAARNDQAAKVIAHHGGPSKVPMEVTMRLAQKDLIGVANILTRAVCLLAANEKNLTNT